MYFVKTPWWLKKLYPKLVWNKSRTNKTIFLTFDDGPIPIVTPEVLKTLKAYNAKATFFCIGDNIIKNPDVFLQLKADGHAIGNHTQNHLKGWATADDVYVDNFNKCQILTQTNLFRPPYGRIKRSQILEVQNSKLKTQKPNNELSKLNTINITVDNLNITPQKTQIISSLLPQSQIDTLNVTVKKLKIIPQKLQIIMWDVLSGDFDTTLSPKKCLKNVLKHTENGSIVVFHDSLKAWERLQYVLPKALESWQKQGFSFEVLS